MHYTLIGKPSYIKSRNSCRRHTKLVVETGQQIVRVVGSSSGGLSDVPVRIGAEVRKGLDERQRHPNGEDLKSIFTLVCYTPENTDRGK